MCEAPLCVCVCVSTEAGDSGKQLLPIARTNGTIGPPILCGFHLDYSGPGEGGGSHERKVREETMLSNIRLHIMPVIKYQQSPQLFRVTLNCTIWFATLFNWTVQYKCKQLFSIHLPGDVITPNREAFYDDLADFMSPLHVQVGHTLVTLAKKMRFITHKNIMLLTHLHCLVVFHN